MEGFLISKKIFTILFILTIILSVNTIYATDNDTIDESCNILESYDFDEDLSVLQDDLYGQDETSSFKDLSNSINSARNYVDLTADYAFDNESDADYANCN